MPTPNEPLETAIAALRAQPYPWFLPSYSIRNSDAGVQATLVATYGFGTPIIIGLAPNDAATLTGIAINEDMSYTAQSQNPQILVPPQFQNVLGVPISLADSGGTIMMAYTDPNGVVWDRVVWKWQCDVQFNATVVSPAGSYQQEIVTWVGDGASNRLIPTSFPLDSGAVAIWICGCGLGAEISNNLDCFRHSGMTGTSVMGSTTLQTAAGIMTLGASGFTVTAGSIVGLPFANGANKHYTAIVMRDTTVDNNYLHIGEYTGNGVIPVDGQIIPFASTAPITPFTHLWIWGANGVYTANPDSLVPEIMTFSAYLAVTMTLMSGEQFVVNGTNTQWNEYGRPYYYMALSADANFLATGAFKSFTGSGTGSSVVLTGFGFLPGLAFVRNHQTSGNNGCVWRSLDQTTTHSTYCGGTGGDNDVASQGIRAMGADGITLGTQVAPSGVAYSGWAFKGGVTEILVDPPVTPPDTQLFDEPVPPADFGLGPTVLGAGAAFSATEGRGHLIVVPDETRDGGWGIDRIDLKVRREGTS
jgi:hypothetical protein